MIDLAETICRYEAKAALFPPGAACGVCGADDVLVLLVGRRPVICATCSARARGLSGYEWHHLGGRPSPLEPVWITANTHRLLTAAQVATWRGVVAPGSFLATGLDLAFLAAFNEGDLL
jgi:hypothetical protein